MKTRNATFVARKESVFPCISIGIHFKLNPVYFYVIYAITGHIVQNKYCHDVSKTVVVNTL